jgi:glycosyltransferase involved in cell wall biosynthesis
MITKPILSINTQPISNLTGGLRLKGFFKASTDDEPLISIITVVFNGEKNIARCIDSVLFQTYSNFEHIIVDGGSTDDTLSIIESYGDKIAFWISEPDEGIYNAFNKAIKLARGTHYIPLGCDDILLPNAISTLVAYVNSCMVISALVRVMDQNGKFKGVTNNHSAGTLIDVDAHNKFGFYDEIYQISADIKFLELAKRSSSVLKIEEVVGVFELGGASSNYRQTIIEHARAMFEAGSWGRVRKFLWLAPRIILSIFR